MSLRRHPFVTRALPFATLLGFLAPACGGGEADGPEGGSAGGGGSGPSGCQGLECFPAGNDGHADPFGAKAAGQARAGRIKDPSQIIESPEARQRIAVGDFWIMNDKVAFAIEDKGLSDGYGRFGAEILVVDTVGADGKPQGRSRYGETLLGFSREMLQPDSVSVVNDGSDGKAAVVRARGKLAPIEFLGNLASVFPNEYRFPAALDFVLEPGSEKLLLRYHLTNDTAEDVEVKSDEMHGFFQSSRSTLWTRDSGYGAAKGTLDLLVFDNGSTGFAWRSARGKVTWGVEISGFQLVNGPGLSLKKGETKTLDHVELIVGGAELDDVLAAVARTDGDESRHEVTGTVKDAAGAPVAGAFVHGLDAAGAELTRTVSRDDGGYTLHVPDGATLLASKRGYPAHPGTAAGGDAKVDLAFPAHATLTVHAREKGTGAPLPVRIQVLPTTPWVEAPDTRGEPSETKGRLWQEFAMNGDATLVVPPGEHRVIVSRGYEWELVDTTFTLAAGDEKTIDADLVHSVDTSGVMCADFHIHSLYSADSSDPVRSKVKSAVADGLDIPVSSEHEWIIDFQPVIEELGVAKWAFGMPSEELTTFVWGHFGVIPLRPKADRVNRGAMDWVGKQPDQFFGEVHDESDKPILIVNHPSGGGFGAYFSSAGFDPALGKGTKADVWSEKFDAVEVFNASDFDSNRKKSVRDWFALLGRGKRVWAVGSSDSHSFRSSPVGYPRTCIRFGHDDPQKLSPDAVRDGLMTGDATISGGLYMTVAGPGGVGPGGTIATGGAEVTLDVTVRSTSWLDASTLEVLRDGETLTTTPLVASAGPGPGKVWNAQVKVKKADGKAESFVVLHARAPDGKDLAPLHPGRNAFAVSNPIFLQ